MKQTSKTADGFTTHNEVRLVGGGKEYFDLLLQLIHQAEDCIHLQSYIYDDDETGTMVAEALKAASKRAVKVYLMADGYASQGLSKSFITDLKKSGIHFRFFEPFFRSKNFYFGRRMHHKVVVVDTKHALVGGLNIADRYNDTPANKGWLDYAVYVKGDIAQELCVLCWKTWKNFPATMKKTPCEKKEPTLSIPVNARSEVRMRRNDWVRRKNEVTRTYMQMLLNAQSHVTILCSYFLPGKTIRRLLKRALKRGVKISVIVAGTSDILVAKNAEKWMYDWLLRNGMELYEYNKKILHGKLALCDDKWMTIGSYNINNISAYASIELNLDIRNPGFVRKAHDELEDIIRNDCTSITRELQVKRKNVFRQVVYWASYQMVRFLFYLFTFYFKQRNR